MNGGNKRAGSWRREGGDAGAEYVSRAEGKIAGAVAAFGFDFRGKTVLDIGSSTGGFTEFALRQGAEKVVAVEKGTNQMKAPLRFDPRVELHEKTDVLDVDTTFLFAGLGNQKCHSTGKRQGYTFLVPKSGLSSQKSSIDVCLADVSFISLRPILEHVRRWAEDYLVMLKPQFEADEKQLNRGVVKNEKMRREIIRQFEEWARGNGFVIVKKRDNEVVGKNGNKERFYWLKNQ